MESDWTEGTVRRVYSAGGRMGKGKRLGSEESRWGGGDAGEGRTGKGLQIVQPGGADGYSTPTSCQSQALYPGA